MGCDPDVDRDTCCVDYRLATTFLLTIRTKNCCYCGTDSSVYAKLEGQGQSTGYVELDKSNYNDFEQGDIDDFTISAQTAFIPEKLCLKGDGWCLTSDQPGVTLYNANLAKGASSKIGDFTNYDDLDDHVEQCRNIQ